MKSLLTLLDMKTFIRRDLTAWAALICFTWMIVVPAHALPKWAVAVFPSGAEFSLEIAADDRTRALGYMFRERVAANEGMLFVFDTMESHPFWMKNCRVALDIIWLDENLQVVEIAHDQKPCPTQGDCQSVVPMRAARYVLEVAGGTARREGLERGDRVVILAESALP
jgi:uncharacterized membrane protein (UPF0127 family)